MLKAARLFVHEDIGHNLLVLSSIDIQHETECIFFLHSDARWKNCRF